MISTRSVKTFITENSKQTQELGKILAREINTDKIICLEGNLGTGKTTFAQGFLKGLGIKGPFTSPTFVIFKYYKSRKLKNFNIYHMDAYRVNAKDVLNLGWKEIVAGKDNIIIIEWADRIKKIIPKGAVWIKFKWLSEKKREILFKSE